MQQHDIHDKETLDALVDGSSARYHELMKIIKDAEEKMAQNKVLKTHIINYAKRPEIHTLRIENPVTAKDSMRHIVMKSFFTKQQRKHFQNFQTEKFRR
ncbi:MAG: hypothetical protein ACLR7D_15680 [Lachnospira eligens]